MSDATATADLKPTNWRPEPMSERVVVRCYSSYREAKRAVDRLAVARIPQKRVTVLGRGLRWQEAFSASRLLKTAAGGGALLAAASAIVLWSLGAFDSSFGALTATIAGAVLGAAIGLALGAVAWRLTKHNRLVPETGHVDVDHYDVLVEIEQAERARELLGTTD